MQVWWLGEWLVGLQHDITQTLGDAVTAVVSNQLLFAAGLLFSLASAYYSVRLSVRLRTGTQKTVEALADAVDLRVFGAAGHSRRVAALSIAIAQAMGLRPADVALIGQAARVHDVGQMGVADTLFNKAGPLLADEQRLMQRHPILGAELLAGFADYSRTGPLVRGHHERPDGQGYPDRLVGEQLPLGSAIIAVAEAFDAMTSPRPYRGALSIMEAGNELRRGRGGAWHAGAVDALLTLRDPGGRSGDVARRSPDAAA
jgi:HD-GYP domain-containing protein (c-di-GMP phosphodiesterase class II)